MIQQLNEDPEFVAFKRGALQEDGYFHVPGDKEDDGNDDPKQCTYSEARRLQDYSGGTFLNEGNGYYELGGDFGKRFDGYSHSSCIIGLRCPGLPYRLRGASSHIKPLLIISGPQEPTNMQPYLIDTVNFFADYGYNGRPYEYDECRGEARDRFRVQECAWLLGAFGDSPFRAKLAAWLSHAAFLGCGYCEFEATGRGEGSSGICFKGYLEPQI